MCYITIMHYEHTWPQTTLNLVALYAWYSDTRLQIQDTFTTFKKYIVARRHKIKCYLTTTRTTKAIQLPVIYATMRLVLFLINSTPLNDWRWGFADANQIVRLVVSSTRMIRPTNKIIYTLLCTSDAVINPDVQYRTWIAGSISSRLTTCSSKSTRPARRLPLCAKNVNAY